MIGVIATIIVASMFWRVLNSPAGVAIAIGAVFFLVLGSLG